MLIVEMLQHCSKLTIFDIYSVEPLGRNKQVKCRQMSLYVYLTEVEGTASAGFARLIANKIWAEGGDN